MAVKNLSYTLISNIISLLISAIVTFIVPKKLGVAPYGYFQLYIFYLTYVGFFHFGWTDGILLRYGGTYYKDLDAKKFSGQFWLQTLLESIIGLGICVYASHILPMERSIVLGSVGLSVILILPYTFLRYVLQATGRIKEYAVSILIEKIVYLLLVCRLLIGSFNFYELIQADQIGKCFSLVYSVMICKNLVILWPESLKNIISEAMANISCGAKLMFANISSSLIIGFVRVSIEQKWDVDTFGKVSLTMSVSNLLMVFIRAVALVMFPMLRRTDESKLSGIYSKMRTCLMIPLLGMLVFYYPAKVILSAWLPQYADSLIYMALLFPMCVFESKMSMLIETYMKTLRKEKWLLMVNLTTVGLSVACTGTTVYWLHNLDLAVVSIVVLLAFRCVLAETLLSRAIEIDVKKDIACELALTAIFITASWFIGGVAGLAVYLAAYVAYLFIKRKSIADMAVMVKSKIIHS